MPSSMTFTQAATGPATRADASYNQRRAAFAEGICNCVDRAFRAIGSGSAMTDYIYWSLSLSFDEIVDRPEKFMAALTALFGEAGAAVYEYKLVGEIQKEFGLIRTPGRQETVGESKPGELLRAAMATAWMIE
jgi:hypothetical protein